MVQDFSPRAPVSRHPKNAVLIIAEGKTEKIFFSGIRERHSNIKIVIPNTTPTDPLNLVELCVSKIQSEGIEVEDGDLAFCIVDVDHNSRSNIEKAITLANDNNVNLIISNPCFEVWFLLHFRDLNQAMDISEVIESLNECMEGGYSKTKDYKEQLDPKREEAMKRASRLTRKAKTSEPIDYFITNPSTGIYIVIEMIDELKRKNST